MKTFLLTVKQKLFSLLAKGEYCPLLLPDDIDPLTVDDNDRIVLQNAANQNEYINTRVTGRKVANSLENAYQEIRSFYSDDPENAETCLSQFKETTKGEQDRAFVICFVEQIKRERMNAKVLLDTNILIARESYGEQENISGTTLSITKLQNQNCTLFYSPKSISEISGFKNKRLRETVIKKITNGYSKLTETDIKEDEFFQNATYQSEPNRNDEIDNFLLWQVYCGNCDYIYTDDAGLTRKAKALFLSDAVLSTKQLVSSIEADEKWAKRYQTSFINRKTFCEVNLDDPFFDTLKADYPGFARWFRRKSKESCFTYEDETGLQGFLYIKEEAKDEDYNEFETPFKERKKRLKVGTFKIASRGHRLGERFIQIIIDACRNAKIDEVYVTLFKDKREELRRLHEFLESWGFREFTSKKNGEIVLLKTMTSYESNRTVCQNYPLNREDPNYFYLPIIDEYHTKLFPDLSFNFKNDSRKESACSNALRKIYITSKRLCSFESFKPGDLIVVYRMGQVGTYKNRTSALTGTAVLEAVQEFASVEEMKKFVKNRSVFKDDEIERLFRTKYRTAIVFLFQGSLENKVTLETLRKKGILPWDGGARVMDPISPEAFKTIIDLSKKTIW